MTSLNSHNVVHCEASIPIPMPLTTTWGQLRDFHRFAALDHFHASIKINGNIPRAGASMLILHRFGCFKIIRSGRILRWQENVGYAFSDLSTRGNHRGFPHVIALHLESQTLTSCRLHVRVDGRWTAPVPKWIAKLWLRWVFSHLTRSIENQLLNFVLYRRANPSFSD
jgi:hypothetical protein